MNAGDRRAGAARPPQRHRPGQRGPGRHWLQRRALAVAIAVVAALLGGSLLGPAGLVGAPPAAAQDDEADEVDDADGPGRLVLEEQTPWALPGEDFAARVRLPADHGGAVVTARLHPAIDEPADVAATARQEELGRPLARLPELDVAAGVPTVVVRLAVGADPGGIDLDPGVYPLVVEASTENGDAPEPFVTHVVVLDADQLGRRPLALVTRVHQPFRWTPEGRLVLEGGAEPLANRLAPLGANLNLPYTLLPTPGTVAALADSAGGTRALQILTGLARRGQVVTGSFARLPVGAWTAAGLDVLGQFLAGEAALTADFGAPPTGTSWLVTPTDDLPSLRWQAARGVRTFLVPRSPTAPDGWGTPPSGPFRLEGVDRPHLAVPLDVVGAEPAPADGEAPVGPTARAHRLLAELATPAVTAGAGDSGGGEEADSGDGDDGEGVGGDVFAGGATAPAALLIDDLGPDARPVVETLLAALARPGPLRPTTVAGLVPAAVIDTSGDELASWEVPPPVRPDLGSLPADLVEAQRQVNTFAGAVGEADPAVAQLQRAVLTMGAEDLTPADRSATLAALTGLVRDQLGTVVLDRDQPVTVTANRADVPITIHNRGSRPLDVALRVESSDLEVIGPAVRLLRLGAGATTDVAVPVRVNRSGDFHVSVSISSPDGQLTLAERTLTVRSTAISGVGVVLSVGALCFLFLWWGRHVHRTRRARRPVEAPAPVESARVEEPVP